MHIRRYNMMYACIYVCMYNTYTCIYIISAYTCLCEWMFECIYMHAWMINITVYVYVRVWFTCLICLHTVRKVSRFTVFHPNVGKTFMAFASSVLKALPLLKAFVGKTFVIHWKFVKTTKPFSITVDWPSLIEQPSWTVIE